jgi:uncharacterized protein YfaS (alpha-2-macroglobulin family)
MSPKNFNQQNMFEPATRHGHGLRLLSLLLLVSLACSIPGLSKPEATETPPLEIVGEAVESTATEQSGPIGTAQDLPPALVEADPPAGAQLPLDGTITLYFNQPMDAASVEGALSGEPQLSGSFDWPDEATLVFTPDAPFLPETEVVLTIAETAQSSQGKGLLEPVRLSYTTSSYLRLSQRLPEPAAHEVDPASAVVAAFNRPVVPLGADPATLPAAFTLEPAAAGSGEWINTSTYIFYPEPALAGASTYQVTVNPALSATDGAPLDAAGSWTFSTAIPRVVSVEPADGAVLVFLDAPVRITFSQGMDTASVEANFSLLNPAAQPVSGEFSWDETFTTLTFTPTALLQRDSNYTVVLSEEAAAMGGATLGSNTYSNWWTVPDLQVTGHAPSQNGVLHTYEQVIFYLSSPVPEEDVLDYITFSPAVPNLNAWVDDFQMSISLYATLDPDTNYTVTVSPELTDRWGSRLGQSYSLSFRTTGLDPLVTFPYSSDITFLTTDDTGPLALVTNITNLPLSGGTVPLQDFLRMLGPEGYDVRLNYTPADETSWTFQPEIPSNQASYVTLPYRPDGQPAGPGLYFLWIDTPQTNGNSRSHGLSALTTQGARIPAAGRGSGVDISMVLAVSNYQTTMKLSATEAFVWAVDLRTSAPGANLPVAIYNEAGELVSSGVTDAEGIFRGDLPPSSDPWEVYVAILGQPGQDSFGLAMSFWNEGVAAWDFDLPMDTSGPRVEAYLYTDRPIYRPGDTVYFRGVVRQGYNGRYTLPDQSSYELIVTDGIGTQIASYDLPLSGFGTVHGQFTIPDNAQPGDFRIGDPSYNSNVWFLVTEYRKPEINLQVTAQAEEILNGASVVAQVNARYFFDAPAGNQPLHWVLYAADDFFHLPGGYQVGPVNTHWLDVFTFPYWQYGFGSPIAEGDAQTGQDGTLTLEIPTEANQARQRYTLEVTLTDESGLPVSARAAVNGNPSVYYIGVKPDAWSGTAERESGFSVLTTDWEGNASPGQALSAIFQQVEYVRVDPPADQPYEFPTYQPVYTPVASTNFVTGADGMARLTFTPPEPGTYQLDVQGEGTLTQVTLWVAGEGRAVWPNLPNQRLRLTADQDSYQPGDTAQVFIPNPFGEPATALLTVERGEVLRYQVLTLAVGGSNVDLPLSSEDAPNVYVSVTVVGHAEDGSPDFRQGYQALTVAVIQEHLNVEVTSQPERGGPSEPVTLTVRVSDASGAPVQGEFSLSVVDEAVLALTEPNSLDIFSAFYGPQPLGVRNGLSLAAWGQRLRFMPGGMGGGGGDMAQAVVREYFPDTAYWNATIVTDANGEAVVTVTLPDTLTTWQVLVRGLTGETWVGEAQIDVVTTQELLIRPVTPRFLVAADHVELAAVAQNNTVNELTGEVRLQASGVTLDDPASQVQAVTIPAGGQVRVSWWGTAQDVASADLLFSLQAGGLSDAVRVAGGELPVLRYTAPQTFATSGTLTEGGERLELVSLPVTFDPTSGALDLELSPSLAAAMLQGLEVLEHYPYECTEQTLSRFLPNLEAYRAVQEFGLDAPNLETRLERTLNDGLARLLSQQKPEGSWGWWAGSPSDEYLTAYVLYGLSRVSQAGISVPNSAIQRAIDYLNSAQPLLSQVRDSWQLDRLAFQSYALGQAGQPNNNLLQGLFDRRDELNPWAQALLALALEEVPSGSSQADTLLSDLQATALRSATGVHWELGQPGWQNMTSTLSNSAMVIYALAQLDPASTLLPDAVNYLMTHRQADGAWGSTYESAWVMLAMTEVMRGTGELGGDFAFGATLNGASIVSGHAGGATQLNPVTTSLPLSSLYAGEPNALTVLREAGSGRLYYTAALQVYRPVAEVQPLERGLAISRQVYPAGADLRTAEPVSSAAVGEAVTVRLTLVLPTDAYYLVVEDYIPAGAEILNTRLQTSQLGEYGEPGPLYDPSDPFASGWGWWLFSAAKVYDDHIAFTAEYLPAGTYELTYTLVMLQAGEYQVLPARAWLFYFPEVQGTTAGAVFEIRP